MNHLKSFFVVAFVLVFSNLNAQNPIVKESPDNGQLGYVNATGAWVIQPQFVSAYDFTAKGRALALTADNKWWCIDQQGKQIIQPITLDFSPDLFSDGMIRFEQDGMIGFANDVCEVVIPARFSWADSFSEGMAPFCEGCVDENLDEMWDDPKWGYINKKGEIVIKPIYEDAYAFKYGIAEVVLNEEVRYVTATGAEVKVPVMIEDANGYIGFKDPETDKIFIEPTKYMASYGFNPYGVAMVVDPDAGWVCIDKTGKTLFTPFIFDNGPDYYVEDFARFIENDKVGFFNEKGEKVIPATFKWVAPFTEGMAAFCEGCTEEFEDEHSWITGGQWGFIDKTGKVVLPAIYDEVNDFYEGRAQVQLNGKSILIDKAGTVME